MKPIQPVPSRSTNLRRLVLSFVGVDVLVTAVNDGWSGRPWPLAHQLLLLPFSISFVCLLVLLLKTTGGEDRHGIRGPLPSLILVLVNLCVVFELLSLGAVGYESHHFARFGYAVHKGDLVGLLVVVSVSLILALSRRSPLAVMATVLMTYTAGLWLAIRDFPLNYLRSDMLPVIVWADTRLVRHLNPYTTMHVGTRVYDFPYLPGMLVAFYPAVKLGVDVRWVA